MGVKYLTGFAKKQIHSNLYYQIDILSEIERSVNVNGTAVIIFDVMGFVHNLGGQNIELNLGGRQHIYMRNFEHFVKKLNEAGASLAFFCDGQLQTERSDEWCRRRDAEFLASFNMISDQNIDAKEQKRRFGCKAIVKSLLKLIEDKRYGDVVISTHVDCDAAIAKYANETRALAVIASDSDFLIFEGNFQWWEANTLNMQRMQAKCFDRRNLVELLNLTNEQMKYFATVCGNDYTQHLITPRGDFFQVADFCRTLGPSRSQYICHDIVKYWHKEMNQNLFDAIVASIKSYDINFCVPNRKDTRMDKYCASNVLLYAFWTSKIFQYEVNFLDFQQRHENNRINNNVYSLLDTLLEVFRKLGGILLKCTGHRNPVLRILTKYSIHERYTLREYSPIYPQGFVNVEEIIFDQQDDEDDEFKWNLLLWSLGLNPRMLIQLRKIPRKYVSTVLALKFLCQVNYIEITSWILTFDVITENCLHFNNGKCHIFSAYRNDSNFIETEYTMGEHVIERVEEINDLGVLISKSFHPGHHIEKMTMKCRQMVGCIKHYSNGNFTKETQRILYLAYVRSRLEFASTFWNPSAQIYKDDIESIQKQFVIYLLENRANATSYRLAPYADRCKQLKFQSLEVRRTVADAVLAFDVFKGNITDDLISTKFVLSENAYNFRDSTSRLLVQPRRTSEYLTNQPIDRMIRLLNEHKSIVTRYNDRDRFKMKIFEELGF